MKEVEKMYKNAGIAKIGNKKCTPAEFLDCQNYCFISENNKCDKYSYGYPPFTAEKQLELIKWLIQYVGEFYVSFTAFGTLKDWEMLYDLKFSVHRNSFEECLAGFINSLWQDLTSEEKEQIRRILNV